MSSDFENWLLKRPVVIQDLARKYPPGEYKIAEEAPYALTCPGTVVSILAYIENGDIRVIIAPEHILPEAIEHANLILHPQGRDYSEIMERGLSVDIDPKYLIPYKTNCNE